MSKTSYKNALEKKRLSLTPIAMNDKGEVITYKVASKDGKFKKFIVNGIKSVVAKENNDKDSKRKSKVKAKTPKQK